MLINFLGMRILTTKDHKKYWTERKIDWKEAYFSTWNHPHRALIIQALKSFRWFSLWEVGVGAGANLARIVHDLKFDKQLGGSDINSDAIEVAQKMFTGGHFHVEASDDLLLSDNSVDVMLTDAHLIYYGPTQIKKVMKEMLRVTRHHIVIFEYHERSFWKRIWIRLTTGYNAYNYKKLLESFGCYNVQIVKMPPEFWPDTGWQKWGHIMIAQIPKQ